MSCGFFGKGDKAGNVQKGVFGEGKKIWKTGQMAIFLGQISK